MFKTKLTHPIIHYKVFANDESFAKWQVEEKRIIGQIQQLPMSFKMDSKYLGNDQAENNAEIVMGVFVTYWDKDPTEHPIQR